MNGKLKLKINQKSSIFNNRYDIFLDNNFVGNVDYKNPKIDIVTNLGNHKILVKHKDAEKEYKFDLNSKKIIMPIEINENLFWSKSNQNIPKFLKNLLLGFLVGYSAIIIFLVISKQIEFIYPLLFPFLILFFLNSFGQRKQKFELRFR